MRRRLMALTLMLTLLAGMAAAEKAISAEDVLTAPVVEEAAFTLKIVDQHGEAVPGVYLTLCADDVCELCVTDEEGLVVHAGDPDAYHLELISVPEGCAIPEELEVIPDEETGFLVLTIMRDEQP